MGAVLGGNQYGKSQIRLLKVDRDDSGRHTLHDLNVSVALSGDLAATHLTGDNSSVLPTDTQKNTVFAFARKQGVGEVEDFGSLLAHHFVDSQPTITWARVRVEEYPWARVEVGGRPADHSFAQSGQEVRTTSVTYDGRTTWVVSGLANLVLLNSTGSEFRGYPKDRYTTLAETSDRVLCTSVTARWRHASTQPDWQKSYDVARRALTEAFADTYSKSLQQTLYAMGERLLGSCADVVEVRLSLPNRHHFLFDLSPFDLDNPGDVFHVDDRPYGLIEGTVLADGAPAGDEAW